MQMNHFIKKAASFLLVAIVITLTLIALLGIWEIISLEHVLWKAIQSLLVIFVASAVILFIFTYLVKEKND
mgnify:CR=1 FL=1